MQPTIKQMAARSLDVHRSILERVSVGAEIAWGGASAGEIRGYRTALQTLKRWGCIAMSDFEGVVITNIGRDLLSTLAKETK